MLEISGEKGKIQWFVGYDSKNHAVILNEFDKDEPQIHLIPMSRRGDFILEIKHLEQLLDNKVSINESPISINKGLETMMVIAAAHVSNENKRSVTVDYSKGYDLDSIKLI